MSSAAQVTMRHWIARTESVAVAVTAGTAAILAGVVAILGHGAAAQSAGLGACLVIVFFGLGALVDAWALQHLEAGALIVVLASFGLRIALLTLASSMMARAAWLPDLNWFAIGTATATIAWMTGLVIGHVSGRWPIYDLEAAN